MPSAILGISAYYHDSAAALLVDGELFGAVQEERFSRIKHDPGFPFKGVEYLLDEAGLTLDDIDAVAYYEKPLLKFERLLVTAHNHAPRGLSNFLAAMPVWIKEKLFLRENILKNLGQFGEKMPQLLFPEHHLSHAASAFYPSPFAEAAILTVDGVGEWATTTIAHGKEQNIQFLRQMEYPHSIGLIYSAFTQYCGFKVNDGEYKLMGLAPYGDPASTQTRRWKAQIYEQMVEVKDDGSLRLNIDYFPFDTQLGMYCKDLWQALFSIPPRRAEGPLRNEHANLALAIQEVTEEILLRLIKTATDLTGCRNVVMAGGVALNCVANGKILRSGTVDNLWVQPASGDAGGAVGAAYAAWHIWKGSPRENRGDRMRGALLGPEYGSMEISRALRRHRLIPIRHDKFSDLCQEVAGLLDEGKVVGWFQGRMEFGPRALGNRSILADPRQPQMQSILNKKIKVRESFRPFAPAVISEDREKYFELNDESPYMLFVAPVVKEERIPLPDGYHLLGIEEKLHIERSTIPAVTHIDCSARIQTVDRQTNERFRALLEAFRERTGCSVLVNTSFNVKDEPIVCSPDDAIHCFLKTGIDVLVLDHFIIYKPT